VGEKAREIEVRTITLNNLRDIELWERSRWRDSTSSVSLLSSSASRHPQVRQRIIDYFARHHYVVVGKYLRADVNNLYFTQLS
jgi:hypothetical protein